MLVIGNYAPDGQRSMQRYAELVHAGMTEAGIATRLWLPPVLFGRLLPTSNRVFKWLAYVDKLLIAPLVLLLLQWRYARVHICDHSNAYYAFAVWGRRCTATCHDVIAIQHARDLITGWPIGTTGRLLQRLISYGVGAVDKIYCVSSFTQAELLSLNLVEAERTALALNAVDPAITASLKNSIGGINVAATVDERYFLHVGSDHVRKNRRFVIELFSHLVRTPAFEDCNLVFVGPELSGEQTSLVDAYGLTGRVHSISYLSNEDLAHAYAGALALIFPSLQEGFGWPVAEAQACGCPVFASALDPMMEVGGKAARYFDPANVYAAVATVADAPLAQMRAEGWINSSKFTLQHMTAQLMQP